MRTFILLFLVAGLGPEPALAQIPRDAPSPAIQNARRERELRALVASGGATKETYLELLNLDIALNRPEDAVAALRAAADLDPAAPEFQHLLGTIAWEHANRDVTDPAARLLLVREGIALEDRALKSRPDYWEAMTYKSILLRLQANLITDPSQQTRLFAEADALRTRIAALRGEQPPPRPPATPPTFSGFGETFEQTAARLMPVRGGGGVPQPIKTRDVRPAYPPQAQTDRVQGVIIIEAIIDPSGSVANARILRSIPALDEAALSAVSRWQFTPPMANGLPVAVMMTVTVNFTIQGE